MRRMRRRARPFRRLRGDGRVYGSPPKKRAIDPIAVALAHVGDRERLAVEGKRK